MNISKATALALSCLLMACGASDSVAPAPQPGPGPSGPGQPISSFSFSGAPSELYPGETATITVTPVTADGHLVNSGTVTWSSSDRGIASVKSTGDHTAMLSAVATGIAVIYASINGIDNSVVVRVTNAIAGQNEGTTGAFVYSVLEGMEFIRMPVGSTAITAAAINDQGQAVGMVTHRNSSTHAFIWTRATGVVEFLDDALTSSAATAISSDGQIAGTIARSDGMHSFIWSPQLGMRDLGTAETYATGINSSGTVVGWRADQGIPASVTGWVYTDNPPEQRPFKWTAAAGFDTLAAYRVAGSATAINDAGEMTGYLSDGDFGSAGALYWSAAGVRTVVPGCYDDCTVGLAINKNGVVAGSRKGRPFTWSAATGSQFLAGVPDQYGDAQAINDNGTVAGNFYNSEIVNRQWVEKDIAFIHTADGHYYQITPPRGRSSLRVTGINNNDQIVGVVQ